MVVCVIGHSHVGERDCKQTVTIQVYYIALEDSRGRWGAGNLWVGPLHKQELSRRVEAKGEFQAHSLEVSACMIMSENGRKFSMAGQPDEQG